MLRKINEAFPYFEIQREAYKKCNVDKNKPTPPSKYDEVDLFIEGAKYMYELLDVEEYE